VAALRWITAVPAGLSLDAVVLARDVHALPADRREHDAMVQREVDAAARRKHEASAKQESQIAAQ